VPGLRKEPAGNASIPPEVPLANPAQASPGILRFPRQFPEAAEFQENTDIRGSVLVKEVVEPKVGKLTAVIVNTMFSAGIRSKAGDV
jgi:hypothetical protein